MVFIYDAIRTPIGKANGIYKNIIPEKLSADILKQIIVRNGILNSKIEMLIMANAFGTGGNMSRYAALLAGFTHEIDCITIDSQCSGGLKSIEIARNYILAGQYNGILAGGMESKSLAPQKKYQSHDIRVKNGQEYYEVAQFSPNQPAENAMMQAAENVANKYKIEKEEMLHWTADSHKKASVAVFEKYIFENGFIDQSIKKELSFEKLNAISTEKLIEKTVVAHYNDAAAVVLMGNEKFGFENNLKPLAKISGINSVGFDPNFAPEGIIMAAKPLMNNDIDCFEISESFAVSPLAFSKVFGLNPEKINVLGGNLAFGHPFGASGTINFIHLLAALENKNLKKGMVVVPAAGGLATAIVIERIC